ncbi:MucBP domain-containing protein, partial [Furfurilactobacillus siliginis]|uniref:MucBP domain-containing protein n=1 Tax=Furfurilactobacillus siliginis TaxID=348151 RepID=UPI001649E50A
SMLAASTSSSDLDSAATYAQNRITIDYVTSDGTHLLDPLTIFGPVGQSFKIATPGFDHYVLREIPAIANQPMPDTEDPHIELVYDRLGAIQIFHDADTTPFQTIDLHPSSNDAQKVQPVRLEPILGKAYFIRQQDQPAQLISEPQKFVPADPTRMTQVWLTNASSTARENASSSAEANANASSSAEANANASSSARSNAGISSSAGAEAQKAQDQNRNEKTVAAEQPHATMTTPIADAMIKQSLYASTSTSAFADQQVSQPVAAQPAIQTPTEPINQTVSEAPEQTITPLFAKDLDEAPQQKMQPVADDTATANVYEATQQAPLVTQPAPTKTLPTAAKAAVTAATDDDLPLMILSQQLKELVNALNVARPA